MADEYESYEDQKTRELSEARRLKRQVDELLRNPVWQLLCAKLNAEISAARAEYEKAVGRSIDELVKNEANRGAIAATRSVLEFPQRLLDGADNVIGLFNTDGEHEERNDE